MRIKALYSYDDEGRARECSTLQFESQGIQNSRTCHHWRQVLLLPFHVLKQHRLKPTDLKENILIEGDDDIHEMPSGTLIGLGDAALRLTFHCEPCAKISPLVSPRRLLHQRGYLAQVIQPGIIQKGDLLEVGDRRFETIPYAASERIRWYLDRLEQPMMAAQLVDAVGLPKSYCRSLPGLLRRHPELDTGLIRFASRRKK